MNHALFALRLNTSTLLHSRLHWRPATLKDIQEHLVMRMVQTAQNIKTAVQATSKALKQEVTERYARSTESLAEDLRPAMELLDAEIQALGDAFGQQINSIRRKLARAYRTSPYKEQMEDAYRFIERQLAEISSSYQKHIKTVSKTIKTIQDDMTGYPVGEMYHEAAHHLLQGFEFYVDTTVDSLTQTVMTIDSHLR